jgi:radical SAM protein with 4Fe4S-binding SPASM domain
MYFRLNPECYFIRGKKCGAILDLIDERVYALDQEETEILTSCEKNNPVSKDIKFLQELKNLRLGNFYPNKIYMQKLKAGSKLMEDQIGNPPKLYRAFLEINNSCNNDCWYCGFHGIKRSLSCMGCNKWDENGINLTPERWKDVIDELRDLECKNIFITGGDLTLEWDKTMDIIDYANGKFTNISVTINQRNLSENILKDIGDKANLVVQTDDLNSIKDMHSNFTYLLVIKPENLEESIIDSENIMVDFVIEKDNLEHILPLISKSDIPSVNVYQFLNNLEYHPCIGNTLTVCHNGDIISCPTMRNYIFGNVSDVGLYTIFKDKMEKIDEFWKLNLDKIEKCTNCEYRYACPDCRSLEESITGKLNGKTLCRYNPEDGEWINLEESITCK